MLDKGFFKLARNVSRYSNHRYKIGAVLVKKKPIAVGYNLRKTHPRFTNLNKTYSIGIHAEMSTIIHCNYADVRGSIMYIYRENLKGEPAIARPCKHCLNLLRKCGVRKIYYTINERPYWKEEKL